MDESQATKQAATPVPQVDLPRNPLKTHDLPKPTEFALVGLGQSETHRFHFRQCFAKKVTHS